MSGFSCLPLGRACGFLLVLLAWGPQWARAQDSTLTRLIRQNRYPLTVSGTQLSGPGWDKMQAAIQQSQFVLIGEDHGIAQIPAFAAAVAQVLKPAVYFSEVDPYVARQATQLVAQPGPATAYLRRYPEALCFFDWAEEFELVRTLRTQQVQVVGLDQVFCTTSAPFYAQLAQLVKNQAAKRYLQQRAVAYEAQNQRFEKLGNDDYVLTTQPRAALDSLLLLTKGESPAARKMAQDYLASCRIYEAESHGPQGHQLRLNLMKRNLLAAVQPYQTANGPAWPKMLFKFGSNHLSRGLSQTVKGEYYDLGSLVQNMADAQEQQSLHLYIIGKQGTRAESDNPYFPAKKVATYTEAENADLQAYLAQVAGPEWSVFDLRPVRRAITTGKLRLDNQYLQRSIMGYDYLIVIPETTASHVM